MPARTAPEARSSRRRSSGSPRESLKALPLQRQELEIYGSYVSSRFAEIPESLLVELLDRRKPSANGSSWRLTSRAGGSHNCAYFMERDAERLIVRVPQLGGESKTWTKAEKYKMQSWVDTQKFLRNAGMPVPSIYFYDLTPENEIEFPYTVLEVLAGCGLYDWWKGLSLRAYAATKSKVALYKTCLQSIAQTMAKFQGFRFSKAGLPFLDEETGHLVIRKAVNDDGRLVPLYSSTQKYLKGLLNDARQQFDLDEGVHKVISMTIDCLPHQAAHSDFVLAPPDLAWQNILVDNNGQLCGLIDLDGIEAVPAMIGWAKCPTFLYTDWGVHAFELRNPFNDEFYDQQEMEVLRDVYAKCIDSACQHHDDGLFTNRSHIFICLRDACSRPWLHAWRFAGDILRTSDGLSDAQIERVIHMLGSNARGQDKARGVKERIRTVLQCQWSTLNSCEEGLAKLLDMAPTEQSDTVEISTA